MGAPKRSTVTRAHHMLRRYARKGRCAGLAHDGIQFAVQYVEHRLNSRLTEGRQTPSLCSADADCGGAECEGLENVGAAADTTVEEDGNAAFHRGDDFGQAVD